MKTRRQFLLFAAFMLIGVTLLGCNLLSASLPTPVSPGEAIFTSAVQTLSAQLTEAAILGSATPSPTLGFPVQTTVAPPPTSTGIPTSSVPSATPTQIPSPTSPPPTLVPCNRAQFILDVTVPDGTRYAPEVEFPKIWQVKNTGRCDWSTDYRLVFVDGDRMGAPRSVKLPGKIRSGESVNLEVDMEAPSRKGTYSGEWMLRDPDGEEFGVGASGRSPLVVEIRVSLPPDLGYQYDFAANYCSASWRSDRGKIYCPTATNPQFGSITMVTDPVLENNHKENEQTLLTKPEEDRGGFISGTFPAYKVKNGDYFIADVGCLKDSQGCDVTFYVTYITSDGQVKKLGSWDEDYDGKITRILEDLSFLDGQTVRFILSVEAHSRPSRANAFWLSPSIRMGTPKATSTPTSTSPAPSTVTPTSTATPTSTGLPTETATPTPTGTPTPTETPTPTGTATETPTSTPT